MVSFTAQLPKSMVNRAPKALTADAATFGDGTTATNLSYAVYKVTEDVDGNATWDLIADLSDETTINITATVSLKLVNGNKYAVAFWADATEGTNKSIYTFDKANCTISANYTGVATSDERLDAFCAVEEFTVNGSSQEVVELHRPFAQLNIGTGDLEDSKAAGQEVTKAGVKVVAYNTLNLKSGEVSGENVIEFALADLPTVTFPVTGYSYLTMNYLLVSEDKTSDNTVTISYDNENVPDREFRNVPLQRNYRTNIYGNLLTSTTDFNVIIKPEFDGEENVEIWDGATTAEPELVNNVYVVKTPAEWAWLCNKKINKSIELAADLDFGGNELGSVNLQGNNLHVDGKDFTIKNVKLVGDNKCISYLGTYHASLFCSPNNQQGKDTVRNLTVKNAQVVCLNEDHQEGNIKGHAAVIFATLEPNAHDITIENVHVIGANVYGIQPVAGIVGRNGSVPVKIDGCSVEGSNLHNVSMVGESGFVASIIGRTDNAANVTIVNTVSKNNTIDGYYASRRGEASIQEIAPATVDVTGVTASGNTVTKTAVADAVVSTTEELTAALAAGKSVIELKAGTYEVGGASFSSATSEYTLVGADKENSIVKMQKSLYVENNHKLTLNNLTLEIPTGLPTTNDYADFGFFHRAAGLTITNCSVKGGLRVNADNTLVENCDFTVTASDGWDGYAVFYYGSNNSRMTINNCTFNTVKKGVVMYSEGTAVYNLTVNNCTFTASTMDDKCAIQMHTEKGLSGKLNITNTTATGFYNLHNGLWQDVNNVTGDQTKKFTVTIDGETVQTAE